MNSGLRWLSHISLVYMIAASATNPYPPSGLATAAAANIVCPGSFVKVPRGTAAPAAGAVSTKLLTSLWTSSSTHVCAWPGVAPQLTEPMDEWRHCLSTAAAAAAAES